ncbi:platelet-derived growth factor subunit A-like protein [Leptotrombidium deliense]|uniref:Platelet-derived growth factor subunit A-like protein n=1 Tax=Leptotrombidium deliense TaxID=299467 RepID=A0A443SPJ5_9ACAR|nr:platelet-derived growth factor subunit A-like protein [Leptotrombidium deliense]
MYLFIVCVFVCFKINAIPLINASDERNLDSRLASIHVSRILQQAKCKVPVPRVLHILDQYPSATKKYLPHCTILHICGSESGCCSSEYETCFPKTVTNVTLHFFVVELTTNGQKKYVQKLSFQNHTECECRRRHE